MILQSADSYFKQAIRILGELKGVDIKLRDSFNYSNDFLDQTCKAIIVNNMLINKIKKLDSDKPIKVKINMNKYDSFLPVLEIII
jgi:hypothetical protein